MTETIDLVRETPNPTPDAETGTRPGDTFPLPGSSYRGPSPVYSGLRESHPVARVATRGGVDAWLVSRYQDVKAALADPALSRAAACHPGAPAVGGSMTTTPEMIISMDGADHARLRKLVLGSFTAGAVSRLEPRIDAIVTALLDHAEREAGDDPIDLVQALTLPLPLAVIGDLLGVPEADRGQFQGWAQAFATVDADDGGAAAMEGRIRLSEYIAGLIATKRREPADDLLSELVRARDGEDRLTEQELVTFGFTLIGAGFDTTACQIANCVLALLTVHRDQWDWLVAHPDRIDDAVEELLRHVNLFSTDTTGFHRVAIADTQIAGVPIRSGDVVLASLSSANRDGDAFDRPDDLRLDRERNTHLAFGHGIHRCLGSHLARAELRLTFAQLIRRFPDMRVTVEPDELRWHPGEINHSLRELPVRFHGTGGRR